MMMKRRQFLGGMAVGVAGGLAMASGRPSWKPLPRLKAPVTPRHTARNLIFVLLEGGPSHVDTFDLKPAAWNANVLGVENLGDGFMWPVGTMPRLSRMTDKFSIVRSITADEAVHERAIYHLLTARRPGATLASEIPHFTAVLSYKLERERLDHYTLPTVVTMGRDANSGFLPVGHRGLALNESGGIDNLNHDFPGAGDRLALLDGLVGELGLPDDVRVNHIRLRDKARELMGDTELQGLLNPASQSIGRDQAAIFKDQCEMVVRLLEVEKGCRVFQLVLGDWDHHGEIYGPNALPALSRAFDGGFSLLLESLAAKPGQAGGASLLDETLVVAMGEFGRTVGPLNNGNGRDHLRDVVPAVVAGGGVKPGRLIGTTNLLGNAIVDPGWSHARYMGINDLLATIYSAMGVDWTERFEDASSGKIIDLVETRDLGPIYDIDTLFV